MFGGSPVEPVERGVAISLGIAFAIAITGISHHASTQVSLTSSSQAFVRVFSEASIVLDASVSSQPTSNVFKKATCNLGNATSARLSIATLAYVPIETGILVHGTTKEHVTIRLALRTTAKTLTSAKGNVDLELAARIIASIPGQASIQNTIDLKAIPIVRESKIARLELNASCFVGPSVAGRATGELSSSVNIKPTIANQSAIKPELSVSAYAKSTKAASASIRLETHLSGTWSATVLSSISIRASLKATPTTVALNRAQIDQRLIIGGVDLSGRLVSWTLRFENDAGAWTLDVELTNHHKLVEAGLGLAPWDPISTYNVGRPLLGSYNPVTLEIKKDGWVAWKKLFTGFAGPASVSAPERWGEANHIRATLIGISQPLKDWMIEERLALRYTNAAVSKEGRPDLLNRIVTDQGFSIEVQYQDDPMFMVDEYIISHVSLWQALENALAPTGFRLVEKWSPITGETAITVVDPLRFKVDPDRIQIGGFSARDISGYEADVRTWVGVVYRDRTDFQEKLVWAEADPSIVDVYGIPNGMGGRKHRKMIYKTAARSLVDTPSEARELASVILWDLETPSPTVEVTIPILDETYYPFELVEFVGDNFSTLVGILDIEHSWSWERGCGQTILRGAKGKVVGARQLWFTRDTRRGYSRELQELEDSVERAYRLTPRKPTVVSSWFQNVDGSPKPVVDVLFPDPPPWANGILLKIIRFNIKDSGTVSNQTGKQVVLSGKNYPPGKFSGTFSDYLVYYEEDGSGTPMRITTVNGDIVYLMQEPLRSLTSGERITIARRRRTETRAIPLSRFYRIEDIVENELIGVYFAWKGRR